MSKFDWLIYNEPETLVELYLSGELEGYLEWYDKTYREQEAGIRKQLDQRYDLAMAWALARVNAYHQRQVSIVQQYYTISYQCNKLRISRSPVKL